jgi:hypothetical protein
MKMPMNDEEQLEFDRMKTARDSLLITNARLNSKTAERTWVGLTDGEVEEVERWVEFKEEGSGRIPTGKLVTYIEAKLKEKNT